MYPNNHSSGREGRLVLGTVHVTDCRADRPRWSKFTKRGQVRRGQGWKCPVSPWSNPKQNKRKKQKQKNKSASQQVAGSAVRVNIHMGTGE